MLTRTHTDLEQAVQYKENLCGCFLWKMNHLLFLKPVIKYNWGYVWTVWADPHLHLWSISFNGKICAVYLSATCPWIQQVLLAKSQYAESHSYRPNTAQEQTAHELNLALHQSFLETLKLFRDCIFHKSSVDITTIYRHPWRVPQFVNMGLQPWI